MADNTILISKYVQKILEEDAEVQSILGTDEHKIFPLLQPDTLKFPFIVHSRTGLQVFYTKDISFGQFGWTNTINYTVSCVSDNYIQALELANAVRHAMEAYRLRNDDINIHPIQLISASEYNNGAFVEELQFKIEAE